MLCRAGAAEHLDFIMECCIGSSLTSRLIHFKHLFHKGDSASSDLPN